MNAKKFNKKLESDNEEPKKKLTEQFLGFYGLEKIQNPMIFLLLYIATFVIGVVYIKGLFAGEKFLNYKILLYTI